MAAYRIAVLLGLLSTSAWAQDRYMVFFHDKAGTPHAIGQPATFLSARALQRRQKAGVAVLDEDLPVTPSYVSQIRLTGAKAFFTSRWMNGVLIEATPAMISNIEALPFVRSTEFVAPGQRLIGGRKGGKAQSGSVNTSTAKQLQMLGLDSMHQDGYRGAGVMIAVLDSGFPGVESTAPFQGIRDGNQIKMTTDFITNSTNVFQFDDHGTNVFSTIAAQSETYTGGATEADFLLFVTEDDATEYRIEEYNWLFAAERADSAGANIIQSSVGYNEFDLPSMNYAISALDGSTAVVSQAAGFARDRGIVVVTSAGNLRNTPWQFITFPADADGILSVGALTSAGSITSYSSVGPTADGRIKPDVATLGDGVSVITLSGALGVANGTSLSAPLITSLVAGLIQAFPGISPMDIIQALKQSASQANNPDNLIGYGIPSYVAAKNYIDNDGTATLGAYPNPTSTTLWLSLDPDWDVVDIVINDYQGKVILNQEHQVTWVGNPLPLDVSGLSAGLYVVRILLPTHVISFRFVKI